MSSETLLPENQLQLAERMHDDVWVVACLCAGWCDVCTNYRAVFDMLATQHADKLFLWIDIEDRADLVGDFDVENFPTLLIQRADEVLFFGTITPEPGVANRLIKAQVDDFATVFETLKRGDPDYIEWQRSRNLRKTIKNAF